MFPSIDFSGTPLFPHELVTGYFGLFLGVLLVVYIIVHQHVKPLHLKHHAFWFLATAIALKLTFILGSGLILAWWLVPLPHLVSTTPPLTTTSTSLDQAITFEFDRPVNRYLLTKTIDPPVPGVWLFESPRYATHLYRRLTFYPQESYQPGITYRVTLDHLTNFASFGHSKIVITNFTTTPEPEVSLVTPANASTNIGIKSPIVVGLSNTNFLAATFTFQLEPSIDLVSESNVEQQYYLLSHSAPFAQGTSYQLTIYKTPTTWDLTNHQVIARGNPQEIYHTTFQTAPAPGVTSASPQGSSVKVSSSLDLTFTKPMNPTSVEANFWIDPPAAGRFAWSDSSNLHFWPVKLSYGQTYRWGIRSGAGTHDGGYLEDPLEFNFTTLGAVKITNIYPQSGWQGVGVNSPLVLTFDQSIHPASLPSRWRLEPDVPGDFSWSGHTLTFTPREPLSYNQTYRLTLDPGVAGPDGLPLDSPYASTFATQLSTTRLSVPAYLQQYSLSCEAATLRMVLAYYGITVTEDQLIDQIGFDTTPKSGTVWGNPYEAFVGNIRGRQMVDGYGVYWGPIARVAGLYRPAHSFENSSISSLTSHIASGHPVIAWTYSKSGFPYFWSTPSGLSINAAAGEHAVVAVGFIGPADNPSQIIVNDPLLGQINLSTSVFDSKWSTFNRSGVVIE